MTTKCEKFPSIDQFRNAVKNIRNQCSYDGQDEEGNAKHKRVESFPTLEFYGTVKLHGTNAAIRQDSSGSEILFQSRERVITPVDDNAGFATYFYSHQTHLSNYLSTIRIKYDISPNVPVIIYGEWCGGNIQKGVALAELDKMFVVFAIRIGTERDTKWIRPDTKDFDIVQWLALKIYTINAFPTYRITVDLNNPEYAQNQLVQLTDEVERECPAGKFFGVSGIGEGIVWFCTNPEYQSGSVFKVKGEKHSASKVKTTASVDIERVEALKDLVDVIVSDNRLNQMVGVLKDKEGLDVDPKNTGAFVKLVLADCFKEELDTIIGNGFDTKSFANTASKKISKFFLNYEA